LWDRGLKEDKMSVVAWITLGLLGANVTLVIIAYCSFRAVRRQQKQSEKAMLLQIRYRLESDVTQIRIMKAQLIGKKPGGWKKLEDREKECSKTISELAERIRGLEKDLG